MYKGTFTRRRRIESGRVAFNIACPFPIVGQKVTIGFSFPGFITSQLSNFFRAPLMEQVNAGIYAKLYSKLEN